MSNDLFRAVIAPGFNDGIGGVTMVDGVSTPTSLIVATRLALCLGGRVIRVDEDPRPAPASPSDAAPAASPPDAPEEPPSSTAPPAPSPPPRHVPPPSRRR